MEPSGTLVPQPGGFRAFVPNPLPPAALDLAPLSRLIEAAGRAIGRLDGVAMLLPDPDLLTLSYIRREAVLSSQIEGTQASLMDVLEFEAILEQGEARVDIAEILNYVRAMNLGLESLQEIPLSRRLLCAVHAKLMRGVRGGEPSKTPGEFRRSQNWIGGASPTTARFVPPPHDLVGDLFADLERFLHADDDLPPVVKAGIAHAQFETIHPFQDGNGRLGRLLITFWFVERGLLTRPLLYLSLHFKQHRQTYIDLLQGIRDSGDWVAWLRFFLGGVEAVADEASRTASRIVSLREDVRALILSNLGKGSANGLRLLSLLFRQPALSVNLAMQHLELSQPATQALLRKFEHLGIVREITGRRRNRIYAFSSYLALFPDAGSSG